VHVREWVHETSTVYRPFIILFSSIRGYIKHERHEKTRKNNTRTCKMSASRLGIEEGEVRSISINQSKGKNEKQKKRKEYRNSNAYIISLFEIN